MEESKTDMSHLVSDASQREHPDVRRRRLLFQCWHRGTQESDLILGLFAETSLTDLDGTQLAQFEALLDCTDPDLFDWIICGSAPPPEHDHEVMRLLRGFWAARHRRPQQDGQHGI
jgi:antitoxin CptB